MHAASTLTEQYFYKAPRAVGKKHTDSSIKAHMGLARRLSWPGGNPGIFRCDAKSRSLAIQGLFPHLRLSLPVL